jgi:hypothetical protein
MLAKIRPTSHAQQAILNDHERRATRNIKHAGYTRQAKTHLFPGGGLQSTIKINMYVRLSPNDEINHEKVI